MKKPANRETIRHEMVKYQLGIRGLTFSTIANEMGVHPSSVSSVSRSTRRSKRLASALAQAIDLAPEDLFPELYGEMK
jgi:lambda repressor-like predicted transcriptional regulator